MAMPKIAPMHQPQDTRLAIAIPPSNITRMIATGVSQDRIFAWREVIPVMNGEACASTIPGTLLQTMACTSRPPVAGMRSQILSVTASSPFAAAIGSRFECDGLRARFAPLFKLLALDPAWGAETKSLDVKGMVVLL